MSLETEQDKNNRVATIPDFDVESDESTVEFKFIEDHLPLAYVQSGNNFLQHPESEEVGSDSNAHVLERSVIHTPRDVPKIID